MRSWSGDLRWKRYIGVDECVGVDLKLPGGIYFSRFFSEYCIRCHCIKLRPNYPICNTRSNRKVSLVWRWHFNLTWFLFGVSWWNVILGDCFNFVCLIWKIVEPFLILLHIYVVLQKKVWNGLVFFRTLRHIRPLVRLAIKMKLEIIKVV